MSARLFSFALTGLLGLTAAAVAQTTPPAAPAAAPATTPTQIRGTVAKFSDHTLAVKTREGAKVDITLKDPVTVRTVKKVKLSSIATGTYLGIATRGDAAGKPEAIEVLVFPEAMRGASEGHFPWGLEKDSMMTNAAVTGVATQKSGRDLTLTYKGTPITIHVPPKAPVVTFAPAQPSDLKPGRRVFAVAQKGADGTLTAAGVTVGTHGVNPPM